MKEVGVKDTAAYRVIRQILDHTRGPDLFVSGRDVVAMCKAFRKGGGSWERLLAGDISCFQRLQDSIDGVLQANEMAEMASRVAARPGRVY